MEIIDTPIVTRDQAVMPSEVAGAIFRHREAAIPGNDLRPLTPREGEVLRSLRRGQSTKQIARELGMSTATVKVHMKTLLGKLQVRSRTKRRASDPAGRPEPRPIGPATAGERAFCRNLRRTPSV
jgi:DNA-binding CsgD family transcriptional regulator